jgi:hypothetical protein
MTISYQCTLRHISENNNLHSRRCKKLVCKGIVFKSLNLTELWEALALVAGNDNEMYLNETVSYEVDQIHMSQNKDHSNEPSYSIKSKLFVCQLNYST